MLVVLAFVAVALLLAPGIAARFGRRVHPADWTRWSIGSLIAGAVALESALVLFALPTVLRALGAHALVAACSRMTGSLMPGGPIVGWSTAATSVLVPASFVVGMVRAQRANGSLARCVAGVATVSVAGHRVAFVPLESAVALTVGGSSPSIVLSSGMRDALSDEELGAVVRHEAAHVAHRHDLYLGVLNGLEHALVLVPRLRRSTDTVRCGIERWADEDAAGSSLEGRRLVRAALLRAVFIEVPVGVAAFGAVATIMERAAALSVPLNVSRTRRRLMIIAMSSVMIIAASTTAAGGAQLWRVLVMPAFCTR